MTRVSRQGFVGGVNLAGTAELLGWRARPGAAEPPPETTTLRLRRLPSHGYFLRADMREYTRV
jgi:NitT/TauT family transport system substrate-binding protein